MNQHMDIISAKTDAAEMKLSKVTEVFVKTAPGVLQCDTFWHSGYYVVLFRLNVGLLMSLNMIQVACFDWQEPFQEDKSLM